MLRLHVLICTYMYLYVCICIINIPHSIPFAVLSLAEHLRLHEQPVQPSDYAERSHTTP